MRPPSPLARAHRRAGLLGAAAAQPDPVMDRTLLYGRKRGLRLPLISVTTSSHMGPARHALAQRAVGGMLEIKLPFGDSNPFVRTAPRTSTPPEGGPPALPTP